MSHHGTCRADHRRSVGHRARMRHCCRGKAPTGAAGHECGRPEQTIALLPGGTAALSLLLQRCAGRLGARCDTDGRAARTDRQRGQRGGEERPPLSTNDALYDRTMDVNVRGSALHARANPADAGQEGGGTIVNVVRGRARRIGAAPCTVPPKHAVIGLTQRRLQYARRGVRINAVLPVRRTTPMAGASSPRSTGRYRPPKVPAYPLGATARRRKLPPAYSG